MKRDKEKIEYKSFEQLKAELFPQLVAKERKEETKRDAVKFGTSLANEAIDKMLATSTR